MGRKFTYAKNINRNAHRSLENAMKHGTSELYEFLVTRMNADWNSRRLMHVYGLYLLKGTNKVQLNTQTTWTTGCLNMPIYGRFRILM